MNDQDFATVNIRESREKKQVKITSDLKPDILDKTIEKWQSLIDITARMAHIPSGLIMKLNKETIEVFLRSNTEGNPYEKGATEELKYGLYCENVIGKQQMLLVPDATKSDIWSANNPDIDLSMVSYLGYPVNWPDGEVFGTVCLLDNKENNYNDLIIKMLFNLKQHIETDLELIVKQNELEELNAKLQEANDTKDKFFSIIAHDLINPFGAVLHLSERLKNNFASYSTNKNKSLIEVMDATIINVYKLLENLLTWARSQRGQIEFNPTKTGLFALVDENIELLSETAWQKNISIKNEINHHEVFADKYMVNTIIRNLLSNAIKFTHPDGNIRIRSELRETDLKQFICISVIDSGVGMTDVMQKRLFKPGQNTSSEGTENEQGTGLGLIISREFVEKHGGRIWAESNLNKGSVFSFTIPV